MTSEKRVLLFTGGNLGSWALQEIREGDVLVGVDRGALFLVRQKIRPRLAIGDFDSVTAQEMREIQAHAQEILSCDPVMKDLTDTEMALQWALEQHPQEILLLGALGTRFDHTLSNVHLLLKGLRAGVSCRIIDEKNEVLLIDRPTQMRNGRFTHISLLPLSPEVTGITLSGFRYPLQQATLRIGDSLGISNALTEEQGTIALSSGQLLVIKSSD
jgi:thiamine pyrophosphokinase